MNVNNSWQNVYKDKPNKNLLIENIEKNLNYVKKYATVADL